MWTESTLQALIVIVSAVFEALPPQARRRAATLIEESAGSVSDPRARLLMATFDANAITPLKKSRAKKAGV